jgi:hypothetical protein
MLFAALFGSRDEDRETMVEGGSLSVAPMQGGRD